MPKKSSETVAKLDIKQVVKMALRDFHELYGEGLQGLALEEAELSDDSLHWFVTLGFSSPERDGLVSSDLVGPQRRFKVLKIDAGTGAIVSMKSK